MRNDLGSCTGRVIVLYMMCMILLFSGCGEGATVADDDGNAAPSGKLASSLSSYIEGFADMPDLSDFQRDILRRALKSGSVSTSDYEQAWSGYKTCMVGKGYTGLKLIKYSNGMFAEAARSAGTEAQEKKYEQDSGECFDEYISYVDDVYGVQQGNPNLYENIEDGFVDCLHRNGLVPRTYSREDYDDEHKRDDGQNDPYSFDRSNPDVQSCEVANNMLSYRPGDDKEQLW
ncbi:MULTISPECIES: hypothetical protein [Bifidobacterium]|uniref:hypothetical protein n=1 Tax=Bifidobacterium TaxID=1678 RepID=UPI001BDC3930|nr:MULTISPECIES: hypothetical protein [Bifidobacterium]MBT1162637.1 hypothetical protein [Bifidobacterium sp. SO1]MBW3077924.1 hypothetical protein [Bifidobacterium simiiventris]